ncbi:citryl-CoA lyase [candidate division WOR-3 bacterium]|uniref:citrate synthase (unknown stereospecificity) n=1 Tax=candidate division WOR-3 bacterium TaxID=2052148 RepID=A0A660SFM8_UNCW3|nr:MAG: citryl-CoA lyase [candidate division WOR-3 bacterium]
MGWKSAITRVEPGRILIRGYPVEELIGKRSYGEVLFLLIKGRMPSPAEAKILEAIIVSSCDHGVTPPSTLTARTLASTGNELNAALAGGVLAISKYHGGAIEGCMHVLKEGVEVGLSPEELVKRKREKKERIPGFGHRIHRQDPRSVRLFQLARELGFWGRYTEYALGIEAALKEVTGKDLPINVDGAIGALLCELEIPSYLANGLFIISRLAGMLAHIDEEKRRERPMRFIDPRECEYDGKD